MKTLNKFRKTNQFCISGVDVSRLVEIKNYLESKNYSLIYVANLLDDDGDSTYVVRCSNPAIHSIFDLWIAASGAGVKELQRVNIYQGSAS